MSDVPTQSPTATADALFDRYTLPKVALAVILTASLVGTWVTAMLNGQAGVIDTLTKWGFLVALGVLTGGLVWKHAFVRPTDLGTDARGYCAAMYDRFDRIAGVSTLVLAGCGVVVYGQYHATVDDPFVVYGFGALLLSVLALIGGSILRNGTVETQFRSPIGLAAMTGAIALVIATAIADVAVRGLDPVAASVRVLHLLTFAVWVGGAVWNIFVAVPSGQRRPTVPVVRAAGEQLERFRWAVRFIIPTLFLTGLLQAIDGLGTHVGTYLGSAIGLAVLGKIAFIALLVVIFKLCPMWRACSPIEGVCELEDLGGGATLASASPPTDADGSSRSGNPDSATAAVDSRTAAGDESKEVTSGD